MALRTIVKISDVNNLSDARYCAGMLVDMMGFNIDNKATDSKTIEEFTAITSWLAGVQFVGEFISDDAESIIKTAKNFEIDIVETIHPQIIAELKDAGLKVIFKVEKGKLSTLPKNIQYDYIHVFSDDFNAKMDLEVIGQLNEKSPVLLGFGIQPENILQLVDSGKISGIAMAGGDEIKPGYKDYDELADILEPLEIED